MSTIAMTTKWLIILMIVDCHQIDPCLIDKDRSSSGSTSRRHLKSSLDNQCGEDTINMFPWNRSMILSYGMSSCTTPPLIVRPSKCKPRCNFVLHHVGCPSSKSSSSLSSNDGETNEVGRVSIGHRNSKERFAGSASSSNDRIYWKGELCLTEDRNPPECTRSRFKCSQYSALDLKMALDICENNATTARTCSFSSSASNASYRRSCNNDGTTLYSTATGSCVPNVRDATRSWDLRNFILPLQNIKFELNSNDQNKDADNNTDYSGWQIEDEALFSIYSRTYATSAEIFAAMESSLFDPYVILFREFNPCLMKLIHSSGHVVFMYLPEYGTLFEFGLVYSASNITSDKLMTTICTVATDDHRLFLIMILMITGLGLSLTGLVLTIVSVFLTKEHRYTPGINLLCLSFSLIVSYVTVAVVKVVRGVEEPCLPEGILHVMAILASLAWMNVMAFDIWNTLSKMYPAAEVSSRRLFRYCAYGWGLPVVVLLVGILADHLPSVPHRLKPRFSLSQCWFYMGFNTWGTVIFYYGPIGVMIVFNLILFILTARILMRSQLSQGELTSGVRIQKKIKYLFKLYAKLFLVMGLTWILELSNLFLPAPEFFIFSDFVNTLQGFFIFLIFTCRVHVLKVFAYYCCPNFLSGISKEDLQKYSRRFSNLQPSTPSRKFGSDANSIQGGKIFGSTGTKL